MTGEAYLSILIVLVMLIILGSNTYSIFMHGSEFFLYMKSLETGTSSFASASCMSLSPCLAVNLSASVLTEC